MDKDLKRIIEESLNDTFPNGLPIGGEAKYSKQEPGGQMGTINVDGIMQEIQTIDEDAFRIYNDRLCPALWTEDMQLDPEVRSGLLKVAEDFYEKTGFVAPILDIYLMGSIANFNWTPESDADVHVIIDFNQLGIPEETVGEVVKTAGANWNAEHEVTAKGHKVEMNIQSVNEQKPHVTGIYSLKQNGWIRKPVHQDVQINKMLVQAKYKAMKKYVDAVINSGDREVMKKAKKYIDAFRQYGLDTAGEMSVENVVFKALRAKGYLTRLKDSIGQVYDKEMSIAEAGKQRMPGPEVYDKERHEFRLDQLTPENLKSMYEKMRRWANKIEDEMDQLLADVRYYKTVPQTPQVAMAVKLRGKELNRLKVDLQQIRDDRNIYKAELDKRLAGAPTQVGEGYGAGIPETDRLKIKNTDGSVRRWQIRSKDAPSTPKLNESVSLNEMPKMTLQGKKAYADGVSLRDLPVEDVRGNIVVFRTDKETIFQAGFTLVYFMDSEEAAAGIKAGTIPYLMVPRGTFYSGGSPITDIWKKKFQKPGTEHILGMMEAVTNEEVIFLDMVTVRPGWQRNRIATLMYDALRKMFPNAKLETSSRTDKGEKYYQSIVKPEDSTEKTDEDVDPSLHNIKPQNSLHAWFKAISQQMDGPDQSRINFQDYDDTDETDYDETLSNKVIAAYKMADAILLKKSSKGIQSFDMSYISDLLDDCLASEASEVDATSETYRKIKQILIRELSREYDIKQNEQLLRESPRMDTLKKNKKPLTDEERQLVMSKDATWHHGPNGESTPAVWKSVVKGKTWYVTNTHRAYQAKPTIKGAINAYHSFIKTTA